MKIAVTYENGNVFQHFGHTEAFKVYDVEDGKFGKGNKRNGIEEKEIWIYVSVQKVF